MFGAAIAKLSRHALTYAVAEQLGRLAGFLLLPLTTGYLDQAAFGVRELLATTLALLGQVAGLNVTAAMSRYYFDQPDERSRRAVISTTVLSVAGLALALAVALSAFSVPVSRWLPVEDPQLPHYLRISLGIFVFQILREVLNKVLQTQERSRLFGVLSVSKLITEIALQIYFLVVLERGLEGLLLAILISEATFACLLALLLLPGVGLRFRAPIFLALFAYSLPLVPNGVLQFGLHSADRYLVGWLAGDEQLGLYALAYKLGYMPNYLVLGPFLLIWYPFVFSLRETQRQREMVGRLAPYFMLVLSAAAVTVAIFAQELVELASTRVEFERAWVAVPLVSLGYWLWGLFQILQTGFYVAKRTEELPLLTLCALLVNLYLNAVLVPSLGFLGAALSTAITFGTLCVAVIPRVAAVFHVEYAWPRILRPAAVGVAAGTVAALIPASWEPGARMICRLALLAIWSGWCWFGGALDSRERVALLGATRGLLWRRDAPPQG